MTIEVIYTVLPVSEVPAHLLRDLDPGNKTWALIRTSAISERLWAFHTSEATAKAAKRRWIARAVHTR